MIGVAVLGVGYWGKNHVRIYKELQSEGNIDVLKICDIDKQRVEEAGNTFGVEYTTNINELLNDHEIQAVSVVTPSSTHYDISKQLIKVGKDVLVEKPMTLSISAAKDLVDIANDSGSVLMAGHLFRFHPLIRELKKRIDANEFGTVQIIFSNRLHIGLPRKDSGVIYALGIHDVDIFCYLLNRDYPKGISAITFNAFQAGIEETAMIAMDFGDAKAYAMESWLVPVYGKRRDLVLIGREKSAYIDYLNTQELNIYNTRIVISEDGVPVRVEDEGRHVITIPYCEPLKEELKHFIYCVSTRSKPDSDGAVGMRAVVMAEGALRSAKIESAVRFSGDLLLEK